MVLKVSDYSWSQTEEGIFISIPLKGRRKQDVDVMCTDAYVKVNFNPYLFECFLFDLVDDTHGKVVFCDGVLTMSFPKVNSGIWEKLESSLFDNREAALRQRLFEVEKYMQNVDGADKEKREAKAQGDKYALREMMELEAKGKQRIKDVKEKEAGDALQGLRDWQETRSAPVVAKVVHKEHEVIPVRRAATIAVSFTAREFPTPERESVKEREEEWLKKQRDVAAVRAARVTADSKQEERNPAWLKDKGNSLFSVGDFSGALAAYSMALDISPDDHTLHSNRAACHIKMRNFFKAIEDSSKALDILDPPVPQNLSSRVKAHLRRGAAFCHLEMYREGLLDYEAALKLDPGNDSIRRDVDSLKRL